MFSSSIGVTRQKKSHTLSTHMLALLEKNVQLPWGFCTFQIFEPSTSAGLTEPVIGKLNLDFCSGVEVYFFTVSRRRCYQSYLKYSKLKQSFLLFTKSLESFQAMQITLAFLSSSELSSHAFFDPFRSLCTRPVSILPAFHGRLVNSFSQQISTHTFHMSELLQNLPLQHFCHINYMPQFLNSPF